MDVQEITVTFPFTTNTIVNVLTISTKQLTSYTPYYQYQ